MQPYGFGFGTSVPPGLSWKYQPEMYSQAGKFEMSLWRGWDGRDC